MATKPVSGFITNYTDPSSGITVDGAWVELSNILYVPSTYCLIVCDVYKDQAAHDSGMMPVFPNIRYSENWGSDNWNTYFDAIVMDGANKDIQKQSITYLQANIQLGKRQ